MTLEAIFSLKFRGYNTNMAKEVIFLMIISIPFVRSEFLAMFRLRLNFIVYEAVG